MVVIKKIVIKIIKMILKSLKQKKNYLSTFIIAKIKVLVIIVINTIVI